MKGGIFVGCCGFGLLIIALSLFLMIGYHEFLVGDLVFLIGIGFIAMGFMAERQVSNINTEQVNKNIQTMNDILWGKKKEEPPKKQEINISITLNPKKP